MKTLILRALRIHARGTLEDQIETLRDHLDHLLRAARSSPAGTVVVDGEALADVLDAMLARRPVGGFSEEVLPSRADAVTAAVVLGTCEIVMPTITKEAA